jgi:uncharacterized membrane protein
MLTLLGVLVVVVGFALRVHPLLVVLLAAFVTGYTGGLDFVGITASIGKAFTANRFMSVAWLLVLPVVGTLERAGIKERAEVLVRSLRGATAGRILLAYFVLRQLAAAVGLTSLGGHAQMVRPLIAPMAEASAERALGPLTDTLRFHVRAHAAAADNIGLFFGEDVFIAIGSILLMKGFLSQMGIDVEPLDLARWALPTAGIALFVHGARLLRFDARLVQFLRRPPAADRRHLLRRGDDGETS